MRVADLMELKECYEVFGGSYDTLCQSFESGDYVEAFHTAYFLKGVSANLGVSRLEKSSSDLTELLRNSTERAIEGNKCRENLLRVSKDYQEVVKAVRQIET